MPLSLIFSFAFYIAGIKYSTAHPVPIAKARLFERLLTIPKEISDISQNIFLAGQTSNLSEFRSALAQIFLISGCPWAFYVIIFTLFIIWTHNKPGQYKKNILVIWELDMAIFLFPALNIIPLNMTLAERWQYFPSIFLLAMIFLLFFSAS